MDRPARAVALHVILPVLAGATIYLLWRPRSLLVFGWLGALGLSPAVEAARGLAAPVEPHVPPWVLLSAPDGLWVYALMSALVLIWEGAGTRTGLRGWVGLAAAISLGGELLQGIAALPGTFDPGDLLACLAGASALFARRPRWPGTATSSDRSTQETLHEATATSHLRQA